MASHQKVGFGHQGLQDPGPIEKYLRQMAKDLTQGTKDEVSAFRGSEAYMKRHQAPDTECRF